MLYSKKYNYIIMYSPKCGCSTIRKFFRLIHSDQITYQYEGMSLIEKIPMSLLLPHIPKIFVVRNPYYRVVSMFTNKFVSTIRKPLIRYSFNQHGIPVGPFTFIAFLQKLLMLKNTGRLETIDCHIQSQLHNSRIDKNTVILKIENIEEKLLSIYKNRIQNNKLVNIVKLNMNEINTKHNRTPHNNNTTNVTHKIYTPDTTIFPDYCHFYTKRAAELVFKIYRKDFIRFGYSKNSYPKYIEPIKTIEYKEA